MQKVVALLEKNVEWIAMGLGALWVLWVVWAYGINAPVTKEIDGKAMTPAEIDEFVAQNEKSQLDRKLAGTTVPEFNVVPFAPAIDRLFNPAVPPVLAFSHLESLPSVKEPQGLKGMAGPEAVAATGLPAVPAPTLEPVKTGRSRVVQVVAPDAAPLVADATVPVPGAVGNVANPTGSSLIGATGAPSPVTPTAIPGRTDVTTTDMGVDKLWVLVPAKFSLRQLEAEYQKVKLPQFLNRKEYLEVQLERQEVHPDGTPVGKPMLIKPLPLNLPPVDRQRDVEQFLSWAAAPENQLRIVQPEFYQIISGDPYLPPGAVAIQEASLTEPAIPQDPMQLYQILKSLPTPKEQNDFRAKLTAEQKRQIAEIQREEEARERQNRRGNTTGNENRRQTTPRDRGTRGTGGGLYDGQDPTIFLEPLAQAAPRRPGGRPGASDYGPGGQYDRNSGAGGYRPPTDPAYSRFRGDPRFGAPGVPGRGYYPGMYPGMTTPYSAGPQQFIGPGLTPDAEGRITLWAHDDTVQPGKIYRYRMRVLIKNPLYQTNMVPKDKPQLARILALPAGSDEGWSAWSESVIVQQNVKMQFVSASMGGDSAKFEVWAWEKGINNKAKTPFSAGPGDMVGAPEKTSGIDFTTGWTVVDVRQVGNDTRVTLVNDAGRIETRYLKSDMTSEEFKKLKEEAAKAAAAAEPISIR